MESLYEKITDPSEDVVAAQLEVFHVVDEMFQGPSMFHHMNATINEGPEMHFECLICGAKWTAFDKVQGKAAHKPGCAAVKLWDSYEAYGKLLEDKGLPHSWTKLKAMWK